MSAKTVAWLAAGLVVLSTIVAPWNGLDTATATRFLPVALEVFVGAVCLVAVLCVRASAAPVVAPRKARASKEQRKVADEVAAADAKDRERRLRLGRLAAWLGLAFIGWLLVCAIASGQVGLSLLGLYDWGTGALFSIGLVGAWAIGRVAGRTNRHIEGALVVVALLNAGAAALQAFGVHPLGIGPFAGRADGFLRNPVYLSALMVGGWWLVAHRLARSASWWWLAGGLLVGAATQAAASRSAVVLLLIAGTASPFVIGWRRALGMAGASLVGALVVVALAPPSGVALSGTSRLATDASGYASRLDNWSDGARAVLHSPLIGAGPGRYEAATSRYRTVEQAHSDGPEGLYSDAHNLAVEYLVTAGIPGFLLLAGFLVVAIALSGWRSPLAGFALLVLASHAVEPQTVFVTPLAFLALGAAGADADGLRAPVGAVLAAVVPALACWSLIAVGSWELYRPGATLAGTLGKLRTATTLLHPWEAPDLRAGLVDRRLAQIVSPTYQLLALRAFEQATGREPEDPASWLELAQTQQNLGDAVGARRSIQHALDDNPQSVVARNQLAALDVSSGDVASARRLYEQSLRIDPTDSVARTALSRLPADRNT